MSEKRVGKCPDVVRRQVVRLVVEHQDEYESEWVAVTSIAAKSAVTAETLRKWVRHAEIDEGRRLGISSGESERMRCLERENRELRRVNEILKAAAAFFGAGLDRLPKR